MNEYLGAEKGYQLAMHLLSQHMLVSGTKIAPCNAMWVNILLRLFRVQSLTLGDSLLKM
jgi:hypothetical protein